MPYGADVVSIAATSSGVSGTITVPSGAHLRSLSLAYVESANAGDVPTIIELSWAQSPSPLRFVPNGWGAVVGTPVTTGDVHMIGDQMTIPLDVVVNNATTVTIKVTSTGNLTVKVGLEWD
jgi:hypothetical protein